MKEGSAGTAEETEEKWEDVAPDEPGRGCRSRSFRMYLTLSIVVSSKKSAHLDILLLFVSPPQSFFPFDTGLCLFLWRT